MNEAVKRHACPNINTLRSPNVVIKQRKQVSSVHSVQAVCKQHTWQGWSCQPATPSCQTGLGGGLSVSPWHLLTESTRRPRPIPARLYQRESQQNGGTDTGHVTSLCLRVQIGVKQMHTTRLANKIPNRRDLIMAPVVERGRDIQYSSRSVVCTKEQDMAAILHKLAQAT